MKILQLIILSSSILFANINEVDKKITSIEHNCTIYGGKSCNMLGNLYEYGLQGKTKNYFKAFRSYKKACDNKVFKGCYNLGIFYKNNKQFDNAIDLLTYSCENNISSACTHIGLLYEDGLGVKKDNNNAIRFYRRACENKGKIGCHNLALLYFYFKKDKSKALIFFDKSCGLGYKEACENLDILKENK